MRDDLLPAQAAIDWAVSKFPVFEDSLTAWLNDNINVSVKELPPDTPNNIIVVTEKEKLPLAFMVEAGAYINVLRSSLDILASAIAARFGLTNIAEAYFPIAPSAAAFASNGYKGNEFIQGLPPTERSIIEKLKPYKGGNEVLYALHRLDIVRKHKRLCEVEVTPPFMSYNSRFTAPATRTGYMRSGDNETVIGIIPKGRPNPVTQFTAQVAFNEPDLGMAGIRPVIIALSQFAGLARSIVKLFDVP